MATEELLKLIQEDPVGYEGYLAYAKYLETINLKQAYLTYENALYFCDDETMKKTIQSKLDEIAYRNGKVEPASIVILCYNNRPLTQQCIESIRETTPEFAREIVIVDNNSQDDSVDYLRQQKDIVLIENDYNAGFPGGCNIGIEAAKPENDIFLLNNDTIMCFNTLYTLRMGLYEKDNYGSAGCVTNNCANNQSVFKSESLDELKEFGRNNNIPNKRSEIKLMLIGFALIVKRKVLEKVGYLDERFNPGNFEDDDLSLRILMNNYQNVLVYNSFLIHLGSVSFNNADYFNLLHKNFDKLIDKYNGIAMGNNEDKFVYLTFDLGYEAGYTAKILDDLNQRNAKATFFITAHYLNSAPDLVKRMIDEGHIVGNHTVNHKSMPDISDDEIKTELMTLNQALYDKFGYEMKYMRPPKGEFSERTLSLTENLGFKTVMWSFAYVDWIEEKQPAREEALNKIISNLHNGEVMLLHATSKTNGEIMGDIVDNIRKEGYEIKSLEEYR